MAVEPNVLWPANHEMVLITVEWEVSDNCDDEPEVRLVSITSSEDDDGKGDGATSDDIVIGEDGSIYLRAESVGYLEGRVYTITYEAVDDSGNATIGSAEVVVPDGYRWRHLEHKKERKGAEECLIDNWRGEIVGVLVYFFIYAILRASHLGFLRESRRFFWPLCAR